MLREAGRAERREEERRDRDKFGDDADAAGLIDHGAEEAKHVRVLQHRPQVTREF